MSKTAASRHLRFPETESFTIRAAVSENPTSQLHVYMQIYSPRVQVSAPAYLTDKLCQLVADVEARQRLRSSSSSSLIVSRTRLSTVDDRAFPVAAARDWNSLPDLVTSAPSVAVFRSRLKTHLFNISYPPPL